jgi:hypothetical protein
LRSLRRIVRPIDYTCRLTRNHNLFVLWALCRRGLIDIREGWALPTDWGVLTIAYRTEDFDEGERS